MRAKEFITEESLSDVRDMLGIAKYSLPYTYELTNVENQDFYEVYRFGLALASVRGDQANDNPLNKDINPYRKDFEAASSWGGENSVVSGFDPHLGDVVQKALAKVKKPGMKIVSTPGSDEMSDTVKQSPIKPFKGYRRK